MTTELTEYRVIGTIQLGVYHCDCRDCRGHNRDATEDIDYTVEARDEEHAKRLAERIFEESDSFGKWISITVLAPGEKPPRPREVELVYLERWNKGLGLPVVEESIDGFLAARGILQ